MYYKYEEMWRISCVWRLSEMRISFSAAWQLCVYVSMWRRILSAAILLSVSAVLWRLDGVISNDVAQLAAAESYILGPSSISA